jgi:hypothetical protein
MKTLLYPLLCSFLFLNCAFAQDQIILQSAEEIKGKVTEIKIDRIVYKAPENPDGPTIEIDKRDVLMIIYENGQVFKVNEPSNSPPKKSTTSYSPQQSQMTHEYGKSKEEYLGKFRRRLIAGIIQTSIAIPSLIIGTTGLREAIDGGSTSLFNGSEEVGLAVGIPFTALGITFSIIGPINIGTSFKYKVKANKMEGSASIRPALININTYSNANINNSVGYGLSLLCKF